MSTIEIEYSELLTSLDRDPFFKKNCEMEVSASHDLVIFFHPPDIKVEAPDDQTFELTIGRDLTLFMDKLGRVVDLEIY